MIYGWTYQAGSEAVNYSETLTFSFDIPNTAWVKEAFLGALNTLIRTANWTPQDIEAESVGAYILSSLRIGNMVGMVYPFLSVDVPLNTLLCDGSVYDRVAYPKLYAVLDAAFIDDADHFHVPDLRSRFIVGAGQGSGLSLYNVEDTGGEESHQLTEGELAAHTHNYYKETYNIDVETVGVPDPSGVGLPALSTATSSTGGDQAHENRPPYIALRWCVVCQ